MKNILLTLILAHALTMSVALPGIAHAQQSAEKTNMFSGHYSREGNNGSPANAINSNIYMKLFADQRVAMLYVPLPYATKVESAAITKALEQAVKMTTGSAYIRDKFGQLTELATVQIEKYGYMEDRLIFECGSLAPCTIKLGDGFLELIKPGVINEHIIRYDHVIDH